MCSREVSERGGVWQWCKEWYRERERERGVRHRQTKRGREVCPHVRSLIFTPNAKEERVTVQRVCAVNQTEIDREREKRKYAGVGV